MKSSQRSKATPLRHSPTPHLRVKTSPRLTPCAPDTPVGSRPKPPQAPTPRTEFRLQAVRKSSRFPAPLSPYPYPYPYPAPLASRFF